MLCCYHAVAPPRNLDAGLSFLQYKFHERFSASSDSEAFLTDLFADKNVKALFGVGPSRRHPPPPSRTEKYGKPAGQFTLHALCCMLELGFRRG